MRKSKRIVDTETKKVYSSMYKAGLALHGLVDGSKDDSYVWYKIQRTFPERFLVETEDGAFVKVEYKAASAKAKTVAEETFFVDGQVLPLSKLTNEQRLEVGLDLLDEEQHVDESGQLMSQQEQLDGEMRASQNDEPSDEQLAALQATINQTSAKMTKAERRAARR